MIPSILIGVAIAAAAIWGSTLLLAPMWVRLTIAISFVAIAFGSIAFLKL